MNRRQIQNLSSFRRFLRAPRIRLAREALPSLGPEWDVAYLTAWCMVGVGSTPSGKNMPEICKYLETDLNGPGVGTQKPKNLSKLIYDKKLEKFLTRSKICRFLFSKYKAALELLTNRHLAHDYKRLWDTSWKGVIYNKGKNLAGAEIWTHGFLTCFVLCQLCLNSVHSSHLLSNPRGPFQVASSQGGLSD